MMNDVKASYITAPSKSKRQDHQVPARNAAELRAIPHWSPVTTMACLKPPELCFPQLWIVLGTVRLIALGFNTMLKSTYSMRAPGLFWYPVTTRAGEPPRSSIRVSPSPRFGHGLGFSHPRSIFRPPYYLEWPAKAKCCSSQSIAMMKKHRILRSFCPEWVGQRPLRSVRRASER